MVSFTSLPVADFEAGDAHVADTRREQNARSTLGESTSSGVQREREHARVARARTSSSASCCRAMVEQLHQLFEFQTRQDVAVDGQNLVARR